MSDEHIYRYSSIEDVRKIAIMGKIVKGQLLSCDLFVYSALNEHCFAVYSFCISTTDKKPLFKGKTPI